MPEQIKSSDQSQSAKSRFYDAMLPRVKEKMKKDVPYNWEVFRQCRGCGQPINDDSTDYVITPQDIPYCSLDCFVMDDHPRYCTCELCGPEDDPEFQAIFQQQLEKKGVRGPGDTMRGYAEADARREYRARRMKRFLEKLPQK